MAPGSFNFYYPVLEVQQNWYSQFDPTVIQSPVFQSNVVKVNQFSSDMQDILKGCDHTLAVSEADYPLMPLYEDARDNCDYPTPKPYAAYFYGPSVPAGDSGPGYQDVQVYVKATDDPNVFLISPAPVVSASGVLAGVNDLVVYLDGGRIEGAISAIDPFNGLVTLTFIPPANSILRIDFHYHSVYPRQVAQGITRTLPVGYPSGNNVGASVSILPGSSVQPQIFISKTIKPVVVGPYSNQTFYQIPKAPVLNSSGNPADPIDLVIKEDGVIVPGHVAQQVFSQFGIVITNFVPALGVTVTIEYFSMELPHPVIYFQWPFRTSIEDTYGNNMSYQVNLTPMLDKYGDLATVSDVQLYVDGMEVQGGIEYVRPLLGHVQLNFMPPAGSEVTFSYYYQEKPRTYAMVSDDPDRLDDTFYGPRSAYTLVSDPIPFVSANSPLDKYNQVAVIGYRYRAFDLGSSSVLNSSDTFRLNDYDKPALKASFKGTPSKISNYRVEFSGEFLYDTQKYIVLNDLYLINGLPALTQLRKGIPPFYRSFNSSGDFIYSQKVVPTDSTYSSSIPGTTDIEASVSINSPPSGLVEYVPVPEYPYTDRLKITSGLKEFTTVSGDLDINLTSICEDRGFDLGLYPEEEYYPNRELRLNDYKDYLNRLTAYSYSGSMLAIGGSDIIKSNGLSWRTIRKGSFLRVGDFEYTVASVPNENTIKLSKAFHQDSGEYDYTIYYQYVNHVDVLLNNVVRRKLVNVQALIPAYAGMTGSSFYAPWIIDTAFADPDPDPYPRNAYIYPVGSTPPAPPLLTSEIGDQNGEQGLLLSEDEASKMVKFRNWDQELFVVVPFSGLLQEPLTEAMDDLSDGTRMLFWNVAKQDFQEFSFRGTIIATSTQVGSFSASDYPNGVIRLSSVDDNVGLNDALYILINTVVHQILPDNSVDIVAIDEFVRIPQGALYLDNTWYLDGSLILSGI
jgi:hypothetical protein